MVLATHSIVGASVAMMMPNHPVLGFCAGFASHFVLDAIPHWDYKLHSVKEDKEKPMNTDMNVFSKMFLLDISKIFLDIMIGMALLYVFFGNKNLSVALFAGAVGGMLPDVLQFVYWKIRKWPFTHLQKIHDWAHTKKKLKHRPILGFIFQLTLIFAAGLFMVLYVLK